MSVTISKKTIEKLSDKESREFFYEEHIESGLPVQIRELRKKRKLTQKQLADALECDQSNISDWENPNYEYTPQIGTLKRLANAFDVPLIVRFGSWEELIDWDSTLSGEKIAPVTFEEFKEKATQERVFATTQTFFKVIPASAPPPFCPAQKLPCFCLFLCKAPCVFRVVLRFHR